MGAVLTLRDVRHQRGGDTVLEVGELDVRAGERLGVLGPNGAGKTTMLRLVAGLESPTTGTVQVDGVKIGEATLPARRSIAYATQRSALLSTTVLRNVELPLRWRGLERQARNEAALRALDRLGVADLAERPAHALSGGEAQRVSLARALALDPALLLLDEPAAGLDAEARQAFFDDLEAALADTHATVLHVSHRAEEALRLTDRLCVLLDGEVSQLGPASKVVRHPAEPRIARLVGYENVVPAQVDRAGCVLIDGKPCGVSDQGPPRAVTLAAWAAGIRLLPKPIEGAQAIVERVSLGPGRWEVALAGRQALTAHPPLSEQPPATGAPVGVVLEPTMCTLIEHGDLAAGSAAGPPARASAHERAIVAPPHPRALQGRTAPRSPAPTSPHTSKYDSRS